MWMAVVGWDGIKPNQKAATHEIEEGAHLRLENHLFVCSSILFSYTASTSAHPPLQQSTNHRWAPSCRRTLTGGQAASYDQIGAPQSPRNPLRYDYLNNRFSDLFMFRLNSEKFLIRSSDLHAVIIAHSTSGRCGRFIVSSRHGSRSKQKEEATESDSGMKNLNKLGRIASSVVVQWNLLNNIKSQYNKLN